MVTAPGDPTEGWARVYRPARHHSSKAINRRDGQKGSRAARADGAVRYARSATGHPFLLDS
ncbi:hypothetical protein A5654_14835 [Mycolicibacterium fortuitum]|nr:hypothetical protein A5654_14835 [Mycolicibacterium fortuitum]